MFRTIVGAILFVFIGIPLILSLFGITLEKIIDVGATIIAYIYALYGAIVYGIYRGIKYIIKWFKKIFKIQ